LRPFPCSHEAERLWGKRLEHIIINVEDKYRRIVATDETKIKTDGGVVLHLDAIDIDTHELWLYGFHGRGTHTYGKIVSLFGRLEAAFGENLSGSSKPLRIVALNYRK
jgi:hypothetical protein